MISDENGNFRIPDSYMIKSDSQRISSISYQTIFVPLSYPHKSIVRILYLDPKIEPLSEVTLVYNKKGKKLSARKFVKKAIKKIPDNYPDRGFSYMAYYRDYQQVFDSVYL